jgi:drug/metabolite transporter (DMT)-like permease
LPLLQSMSLLPASNPATATASRPGHAPWLALGAIGLWAMLAPLGVLLSHVPPFFLTGFSLCVGGLIALPLSRLDWRQWRVPYKTLLLGVYGLFGFHFLLFLALRLAPPVQANLVNYLWPLGIVVMAPLFLPGLQLRIHHVVAAAVGFAGAALAIAGPGLLAGKLSLSGYTETNLMGFGLALCSGFIWASYSLMAKRVPPFPTAAVGSFALVSGVLSLLCHALLEPVVALNGRDIALLVLLGLGPLGGAFFLWDAAFKRGDPRKIGLLSFLTPLLSTIALSLVRHEPMTWPIAGAALLILGAAWYGSRSGRTR